MAITFSYKLVPLDDVDVDEEYQRRINLSAVRRIASDFRDTLAGTPDVSLREDGRYYVITGQHRIKAAKLAGRTTLHCKVWKGLSESEEAEMFEEQDRTTRNHTPFEKWRSGKIVGRPDAVAINRVTAKNGFTMTPSDHKKPTTIAAAGTLTRVVKRHGEMALDGALATLREWPSLDGVSPSAAIIAGLTETFSGHPQLDPADLAASLASTTHGRVTEKADKEARKKGLTGRSDGYYTCVSEEIVRLYNRNRPTGKPRL